MKQNTNESITKKTANLDEIINNSDEMEALLHSREFLTAVANDLVNGKRNVIEWKLVDGSGSLSDVDPDSIRDTFGVDYIFDFKYNYQGTTIPLALIIAGEVPFKVSPVRGGNYFTAPEGGEAKVDLNNLGNEVDLTLTDKDGSELPINWLTPELEKKLIKQVLQDYI